MEDEGFEFISDDETVNGLARSESDSQIGSYPENMGNLALMSESHQSQRHSDDPPASEETFNEDLPAVHSYLGENLEEVSGRMIYTELRCVKIPLLSGSYGTLLPGQTFPLTVRDYARTEMLRKCVEGDHTFGCLAPRNPGSLGDSMFGTTAEIYEFSDEMGTVCIKARGRQRFKLISTKRTDTRYRIGEVYILPEIKLQHPFTQLQFSSLNSLRILNKEKCRRIEASLLVWPKWVYDMYDVDKLVERADRLTFLKQGLRTDKGRNVMPRDPSELSFWIANLLDAEKKLFMLTLNSPIPRLRWLLGYLSKNQQYICLGCEIVIGKQSDVFAMSIEGAQTTYVNAEGYHHDTFTLLKAENIVAISSPSTHFSWFPGYAWSIAICRQCQKHLGWQFIATKPRLQPAKFWGLTRQALDTRICSKESLCKAEDMPVV